MSKQKILILVGIVALGILAFALYANRHYSQNSITPGAKLQLVTSFYPLYFFTSQIVGDRATVYNLTPAGAEPHDYEPTAEDLVHIEDSRLLILNGGKL